MGGFSMKINKYASQNYKSQKEQIIQLRKNIMYVFDIQIKIYFLKIETFSMNIVMSLVFIKKIDNEQNWIKLRCLTSS